MHSWVHVRVDHGHPTMIDDFKALNFIAHTQRGFLSLTRVLLASDLNDLLRNRTSLSLCIFKDP